MSQAKPEQPDAPARVPHVGLVAGGESLAALGPVVRHMVVALLDEPMSVTLVHPTGTAVPHLPVPPVRDVRYAPPRVPLLRRDPFRPVREALAPSPPDVLHALDTDAIALTRHLAAELDLAYLVHVMGMDRSVRLADPRCRMLLAGSEPIRKALLESRTASPESVALLRPGIHRTRHTTCFMDPGHSPAIVTAGALRHVEPFAPVLEAFAHLQAAQKDCVFFLVGTGRAEHSLRRMAEKLHLMHALTFVEQQEPEQLKAILHGADIFLWPTPEERIRVDVLTAMSAGVPVLTPPMPAADFIIPDRTALIFEPGNAGDLAARLLSLLDDRAHARELAQNALALLKDNHSPAHMADQLAGFYHTALGAPVP